MVVVRKGKKQNGNIFNFQFGDEKGLNKLDIIIRQTGTYSLESPFGP